MHVCQFCIKPLGFFSCVPMASEIEELLESVSAASACLTTDVLDKLKHAAECIMRAFLLRLVDLNMLCCEEGG